MTNAPATATIPATDRWHTACADADQADAIQARLHAQLAARYRTRADDGADAERVLVRFAAANGGTRWVHAQLLARYADGTARVRLLEGADRRMAHVHQRSVAPLSAASAPAAELPCITALAA